MDDTADADKPVSTAQAAALDGKAPVGHTHTLTEIAGAGSAAESDADEFATSAQGALADTAIQQTADIAAIVKITQSAYDALDPKVSTTLYIIVG